MRSTHGSRMLREPTSSSRIRRSPESADRSSNDGCAVASANNAFGRQLRATLAAKAIRLMLPIRQPRKRGPTRVADETAQKADEALRQ